MPRLLDHFSPVISEALSLSVALASDGHLDSAVSVRSRLAAGVRAGEAAARSEVRADQDIVLAKQAVVAWIDEVMLGYPEWGSAAPNLQGELLGTQVAREIFFTNLDNLKDSQDEVREIYCLLLCLGFKGYYGELSGGEQELERLMDVHCQQLNKPPASIAALVEERLTAQPYSVRPPPAFAPPAKKAEKSTPRPVPAQPLRWGLIPGLVLGSLVLLGIAAILLFPVWLRHQVESRLAGFECAHLEAAVGSDRIAKVDGYVASDADRLALLGGLEQISGLAGVDGLVDVHPWPFCAVLEEAWPRARSNDRQGHGADIGLADPDQPLRHRYAVVIEATAPDFDSHLHVFYVHSDGGVVPLMPSPMLPENQHAAGAKVALGEEGSPFRLQVAPPFGTDMLLLYATSTPLLAGPPTDFYEDLDGFVNDIAEGLRAVEDDGGQTAASFSFIETKP